MDIASYFEFAPPKFTRPRPAKDDRNPLDGSFRFRDKKGRLNHGDYEDALIAWGVEKAKFEEAARQEHESLENSIRKTAAAHNVS